MEVGMEGGEERKKKGAKVAWEEGRKEGAKIGNKDRFTSASANAYAQVHLGGYSDKRTNLLLQQRG